MGFLENCLKALRLTWKRAMQMQRKCVFYLNHVVTDGNNYKADFRLYRGCQSFQLWICSWKQNKNRKFNCWLE